MTGSDSTKVCRDCHKPKPLTEFHKNAQCKDGRRPECRECVKDYRKAYYQKHSPRLKKYSQDFYETHRDGVLDYQKTYYIANSSRRAAYHERWRTINRESFLRQRREYHHANKEIISQKRKIYQRQNRKRLSEASRRYALAHPERVKLYKDKNRAKRKQASGTCSTAQWLAKCEYWNWSCYLCRVPLTSKILTIEHRIPLTRGGTEWPANLAPACLPCNLSKSNKTESEYRDLLRVISVSKN